MGCAALALLGGGGCARPPPRLDVRVDSEIAWGPGERVQSVVLHVRRGGVGGAWSRMHTTGLAAVPLSVALVGSEGEAGAPVWVEALGCGGTAACTAATALVAQRAVGRFARAPAREELSLRLMTLCAGVPCASDQRCTARGACEPVSGAAAAPVAERGPWCPAGMRLIPAGMFLMGSERADDLRSRPLHGVRLGAFCLDEVAVTVAAYGACVASTVCAAPGTGPRCRWGVPGREQLPVNCVDWSQARAFCQRRSADLPTEAQWEYVARAHPPEPASDVAEWTLDWFAPYGGAADSYVVDPPGAMTGSERVYRGAPGSAAHAALRGSGPPTLRSAEVGLRCARAPLL